MAKDVPDHREVTAIARAAGAAIMEELANADTLNKQFKGDDSPVSNADLRANEIVLNGLQRISSIPILSEEDTKENHARVMQEPSFWTVDPLDGTRTAMSYAEGGKHNTGFGVHIALVRDGLPVSGVAFFPAKGAGGALYYTDGKGQSFRQRGDEAPQLLRMKRPPFGERLRATVGYRSSTPTQLVGRPLEIVKDVGGGRIIAAAEGSVDMGYMGNDGQPFSFWDVAAAHAILHGAGGEMIALAKDHALHASPDALKHGALVRYDRGYDGKPIPAIEQCLAAHRDTLRLLGADPALLETRARQVG